ncbi:MAG: DedA family protein [Candidatus Doudnabacteria bacterium]|jgi:membrane protein DedA with SNARE-associated domain
MIENILGVVTNFIIHIISSMGYLGVGFLMAIQTMAIPMPSEVILPFAGSLIVSGRFTLWGLALVGALGSGLGSSIAYYIGFKGGRPLINKYGRFILISTHDLDLVEKFFSRFGSWSAFFGQLLPVVRSFIAFPAGASKMSYKKFILFSMTGSFIWSLVLVYFGMKLGENWSTLREKLHGFDTAIIVLIIIGGIWWVWRHIKQRKVERI